MIESPRRGSEWLRIRVSVKTYHSMYDGGLVGMNDIAKFRCKFNFVEVQQVEENKIIVKK